METIYIDKEGLVYIGFWKRVRAHLLDVLILLPLMIPYMLTYKYFIKNQIVFPIIAYYFLYYGIQIFMIVRFGGSPGKLILNFRIINEKGDFLTVSKAILRASLVFPITIIFLLMNFVLTEGYYRKLLVM